jgi:plasmid stabilization system protein ParE
VSYRVRFTREALADLDRLYAFVLEPEMERAGNVELAERALEAIEAGIAMLRYSPFTCRKAGHDPFIRELVIPFGHSGYVALFEIQDSDTVSIAAIRHQREDDYH